jgi:HD-GYP domain-containing protein (c-di-GMP phosphodiesterase class II)
MEENQNQTEIIEELGNQLAEHFYQTIQILSSIAALQERYYEGSHSRWVSQKSVEVARKLSMSESEIFELEIAALLHDLGKVAFREPLLAKFIPEMKENEYLQYIRHPEIGKQVLDKHSGFASIAEIILQHHEKIDGSGFPNHLQGKEIKPGAAIIAVVDTFHNAFYKRHKENASQPASAITYMNISTYLESTQQRYSSAMNYINQKAGAIFDTKVVSIFSEIMEYDRKSMGQKTIMRLPISKLEAGMAFAENYFTSFGLLIAARGEIINDDMIKALFRFTEANEIPPRILVLT